MMSRYYQLVTSIQPVARVTIAPSKLGCRMALGTAFVKNESREGKGAG